MAPAVVLERDNRLIHVWLSDESRVMDFPPCELSDDAAVVVGSPLEIKKDSRERILDVKILDRPLKVNANGEFLDMFIFPTPTCAYSLYFGKVAVDSRLKDVAENAAYLLYLTWDTRRDEMIILDQRVPKKRGAESREYRELADSYDSLYPSMEVREPVLRPAEAVKKERVVAAISPMQPTPPAPLQAQQQQHSRPTSFDQSISDREPASSSLDRRMDAMSLSSSRASDSLRGVPYLAIRNTDNEKRKATSATAIDESTWYTAIVTGSHRNNQNDQLKFFVWTKVGVAVVYPRAYDHKQRMIKPGDYLEVQLSAAVREDRSPNVERFNFIDIPSSHSVRVVAGDTVLITCKAVFVDEVYVHNQSWCVLTNDILGRVVYQDRLDGRKGRTVLVTVKRLKPSPGTSPDADWTVVDMAMNTKPDDVDMSIAYVGIVARVMADSLFVACANLPEDAILYERHDPDKVIGCWLRFSIYRNRGDPPNRYRVKDYSEIPDVYPTRLKSGLPEIYMRCSFGGEMDKERAILHCDMGEVRDEEGLLDGGAVEQHGQYDFWILRFFKRDHVGRWRISSYEKRAQKLEDDVIDKNRSVSPIISSRSDDKVSAAYEDRCAIPSKKPVEEMTREEAEKEARSIVKMFILDTNVREAIMDVDPRKYNEIVRLVFEH